MHSQQNNTWNPLPLLILQSIENRFFSCVHFPHFKYLVVLQKNCTRLLFGIRMLPYSILEYIPESRILLPSLTDQSQRTQNHFSAAYLFFFRISLDLQFVFERECLLLFLLLRQLWVRPSVFLSGQERVHQLRSYWNC